MEATQTAEQRQTRYMPSSTAASSSKRTTTTISQKSRRKDINSDEDEDDQKQLANWMKKKRGDGKIRLFFYVLSPSLAHDFFITVIVHGVLR